MGHLMKQEQYFPQQSCSKISNNFQHHQVHGQKQAVNLWPRQQIECVFAKQCEKITAELWNTETDYSQKLPGYLEKLLTEKHNLDGGVFMCFMFNL